MTIELKTKSQTKKKYLISKKNIHQTEEWNRGWKKLTYRRSHVTGKNGLPYGKRDKDEFRHFTLNIIVYNFTHSEKYKIFHSKWTQKSKFVLTKSNIC